MNIPATVSAEEAAAQPWEAVVVGAGPAGSLAARQLAQAGVRVLLVDRAAFPRWKVCGCCLNSGALTTLHSVGLGHLASHRGAVSLGRVCLAVGGRSALLPLPPGAALSREVFDAALVESAVEAGAAFLPQTQARALSLDSRGAGRWPASRRQASGLPHDGPDERLLLLHRTGVSRR